LLPLQPIVCVNREPKYVQEPVATQTDECTMPVFEQVPIT
jgi:hypothetical protein